MNRISFNDAQLNCQNMHTSFVVLMVRIEVMCLSQQLICKTLTKVIKIFLFRDSGKKPVQICELVSFVVVITIYYHYYFHFYPSFSAEVPKVACKLL